MFDSGDSKLTFWANLLHVRKVTWESHWGIDWNLNKPSFKCFDLGLIIKLSWLKIEFLICDMVLMEYRDHKDPVRFYVKSTCACCIEMLIGEGRLIFIALCFMICFDLLFYEFSQW